VGGTWPWIFFVPPGWIAMRAGNGGPGSERAPSERASAPDHRRSAASFLAIWFVVIFVFFSIPRSKLGTYILPALPPLAIFAGCGLSRLGLIAANLRRRILAAVAIANVIFALAGFVLFEAVMRRINPSLALDGFLLGLAVLSGAIMMYALGRETSRVPYAIGAIALAMLATVPLASRVREHVSSVSTYRNLAHIVQPFLATDCVLGSYRHYIQSLPFYTGRRETRVLYWGELSEVSPTPVAEPQFIIGSEARLAQIWSSGACMILIANERDLPALRNSLRPPPAILGFEGKKSALYNGAVAQPSAGASQMR